MVSPQKNDGLSTKKKKQQKKVQEEPAVVLTEEEKQKYRRSQPVNTDDIVDHKLKVKLNKDEAKYEQSAVKLATYDTLLTEQSGYLECDEDEVSWQVSQRDIRKVVDITSQTKSFELNLNHGPYKIDYTRNGRQLLLGGKRGHVVVMEWQTKKLMCEINVGEQLAAVKFLHSENMFAAAHGRSSWTYLYDNEGTEIHCMKMLDSTLSLHYLPYHWLLVAGSRLGWLQYLDVSTGQIVSKVNTKLGPLRVMTQNPHNAMMILGNHKGFVQMWSPNMDKPALEIIAHKGTGFTAFACDREGRYLATAGENRKLKIFDLRMHKELHSYTMYRQQAVSCLDFSQRRVLAATCGNVVNTFKDPCTTLQEHPYLVHKLKVNASDAKFCPYEDVLGVGRQNGFESLLIPGASEPNYDGFESNPYRNKKQRQEWEVKALLEKIPFDQINLDPNSVNKFDQVSADQLQKDKIARLGYTPEDPKFVPRHKMKGRSKTGAIEKRKNNEIEKKRRQKVTEIVERKRKEDAEAAKVKEEQNEKKRRKIAASTAQLKASTAGEAAVAAEPVADAPVKYTTLNRFKK